MLGKLLCKLGVHDNMISGWILDEYNRPGSVWGFCLRCNKAWQLDN